jgi:hypothetical protein
LLGAISQKNKSGTPDDRHFANERIEAVGRNPLKEILKKTLHGFKHITMNSKQMLVVRVTKIILASNCNLSIAKKLTLKRNPNEAK